jgi:hypothetical protein
MNYRVDLAPTGIKSKTPESNRNKTIEFETIKRFAEHCLHLYEVELWGII